MKFNKLFLSIIGIVVALLISFSCSKEDDNGPSDNGEPTMLTETRSGSVKINPEATLNEDDLNVTSFAESTIVEGNGDFSVQANEAEKYQLLFFNSKTTNNPVYIGLYDPLSDKMIANDTSTALSLTLFNPYLTFTNQSQRQEYIQAVKQNSKFPQLLSRLNEAYQTNASTALNYDENPAIYQLSVQIMKETMETLGSKGGKKAKGPKGDPPYIEDESGENITFINPRHTWYAAGIYPNEGALDDVATLQRKQTILSSNWGFPPVIQTEPTETSYSLGDGSFKIDIAKGLDFSKIGQWNDPEGRATIYNTGQSLLYITELVIGHIPQVNFAELPNHFHISEQQVIKLSNDIAQQNVEGFLIHFTGLMADNSEEIALWIWEEVQSNAAHHFLSTAAGIFKKVSFVLDLLGYVNEQGPFFWDMIFAPSDITYNITQQDGVITSTQENSPPVAEFSISPSAGIVGTEFTFDASSSTDDEDDFSDLEFRWDYQADGNWDTDWDNEHSTITHSYAQKGSYTIILEVKDDNQLIGSTTHNVNVGGGSGTANHVKLFMDNYPWESSSMITMLEELGFTEGTGENTYEIISSDQMETVELIPGEDLVIISNDQDQGFYNNYADVQIRFTNFVHNGGSMFWEACDEGWAEGSISEAGIELPGNLSTEFDYDYWNYVTDQNLPLVSGLPESMDHNYASHESFSNLPDGTTVYCDNEDSEATLLEFNLGSGWIIITGQPLEHQYENVYGDPDMEELLPRIVSYFTGQSINKSMYNKSLKKSKRASH